MKDEYQVRIAALEMTFKMGGLSNEVRPKFAAIFEQYILNGYTGEAKPAASQAPSTAPETEGKDPPKRRTKRGSEAPDSSGEASEPEQKGDYSPPDEGRPSSRVAGVGIE